MDKPEDSQKSKPPGDAPKTYMSPKLRGKMNLDDDDDGEGSGPNVQNIVAIVMVVVIAGLGFLLYNGMQKSKAEAKAAAAQAARVAREQAVQDSLRQHADSLAAAAREDSVSAYEKKHPKPKQPAATAATGTPGVGAPAASAAPATPPPPPAKFGIDVGTFLNQDKANSEQTRLQGATGLTAKVEPTTDGGVTSYRIVLGEFPSRAAAEKKANELIVAQSIREAHVIKLKAGG